MTQETDNLTKEQYDIEWDFVVQHLKKNNCPPTFYDAIQYGYRKAVEKAANWFRVNDSYSKPTDSLVNEFYKAMEE